MEQQATPVRITRVFALVIRRPRVNALILSLTRPACLAAVQALCTTWETINVEKLRFLCDLHGREGLVGRSYLGAMAQRILEGIGEIER